MLVWIPGTIAVIVGLSMVFYAVLGRWLGRHKPIRWSGGGQMTLGAEVAVGVFIASIGAMFLTRSAAWTLLALSCWAVGFASQSKSARGERRRIEALREENAQRYPGVFDGPPADELDSGETPYVDIYDVHLCEYLGRVEAREIYGVWDTMGEMLDDDGNNDIYLMVELLETKMVCPPDSPLYGLLKTYLDEHGDIMLRWVPVSEPAL